MRALFAITTNKENVTVKWEYEHQTAVDAVVLGGLLNGFGRQGWELVAVVVDSRSGYYVAYFKRPIPN